MRGEKHDRNLSFPASFGGRGYAPLESRVRIVGGGLTGILAAFQAHCMGARDIELYERLDRLGGIAQPDIVDGREMREGCIYFGPEGDPIRTLLEEHGAEFADFENRFGSVSTGADGLTYLDDFGGPSLPAKDIALTAPEGETLGDRLASYSGEIAEPLERYVRWHTGCEADDLHESAALPMAINRVFPAGAPLETLAEAKRSDDLANEVFGIPRKLWGYTSNARASLPVGGFDRLFAQCREALAKIGVRVHDSHFATAKRMLGEECAQDIVVWAASPIPLFKPLGIAAPRGPVRKFATYTFSAHWSGPVPFYVQNFTARGSVFRVYVYKSAGSVLLTAECVEKCDEAALKREIHTLLEGFDGALSIGPQLHQSFKPRWLFHSLGTITRLKELRDALAAHRGNRFVTGAWETYAKGEKFVEVQNDLQNALLAPVAVNAP
ncbi:NAD(P)-binding protein [Qipengyuania nanhaisediminis]|uniref:NAD(P)-binding protein n=1 Tax=Qipengyuania nanhaisediminis TaxID=604088 RepID=UPI0038B3ACB5